MDTALRHAPFATHLGDLDTFADGPPHALFARMREEAPVMWTDAPADWPEEDQPGFWSVTRAADVAAVSKDPITFSSWLGGFTMRTNEVLPLELQRSVMIGKDGDEHTRMRSTVNKTFTPWRVRELEPLVRERCRALVDAVLAAGRCDVVADLSGPLANATIADLLGVPEADRAQLNRWTDAFLSGDDEIAGGMRGDEALAATAEYLMGLLLERERNPAEDLITALGLATYDGEPMPREEQIGVFSQLFAAGIDSTKSTIASGVRALIEHPDQLALVQADPALVPSAVEEILRWSPPFTHMRRTATRDTVLGGQEIKAGDAVVVWLSSSCRDPRAIERPDEFDVTRGAKTCPHHAFGGGGRHFCLGAGLARLELTVFFETFLPRVRDLALAGTPQRIRSCFVDGLKSLPVSVTAARPRVAAVPERDDRDAIARLEESVALQQQAFRADPYPDRDARAEHLQALAGMLMGNRDRIRAALAEDFGAHPDAFTDLLEILGPAGRVAYALERLDAWMADERRAADPALFGTAEVVMRYEPKGVIGNIAPWNFPIEIGTGPLVEMLAAGNRVIVKPSDLTPACGELLAELIAATFDRDHVTVVVGGLDLARAFSRQPWDHLLYTGSPEVGKEVMRAAAEHLVPVTLELGGKCPAVLTPGAVTRDAVEQILGTKLVKNGQMCITVDHVLVPRDEVEEFVTLAAELAPPGHSASADCVGIISERHLARLEELLEQARAAGARIVELEPGADVDRAGRRMPLSLVVDPDPGLRLCREEVFGPILPVLPYDDLGTAVAALAAGERPLGLYVFGDDRALCEDVLRRVRSGGACINACAMQGALPALGFGGSGRSGMGRHHGIEGFREFSTARGVFARGTGDNYDVLFPPYGEKARAVAEAAFTG